MFIPESKVRKIKALVSGLCTEYSTTKMVLYYIQINNSDDKNCKVLLFEISGHLYQFRGLPKAKIFS